jgi:hypothetical protein
LQRYLSLFQFVLECIDDGALGFQVIFSLLNELLAISILFFEARNHGLQGTAFFFLSLQILFELILFDFVLGCFIFLV